SSAMSLPRYHMMFLLYIDVTHPSLSSLPTRRSSDLKRRQATLMGDFRERIGLVHELGQLRRPEELTHSGSSRLGVDQVLRHHRVDRKSTRLNSSHVKISYAVFCLKKKTK